MIGCGSLDWLLGFHPRFSMEPESLSDGTGLFEPQSTRLET